MFRENEILHAAAFVKCWKYKTLHSFSFFARRTLFCHPSSVETLLARSVRNLAGRGQRFCIIPHHGTNGMLPRRTSKSGAFTRNGHTSRTQSQDPLPLCQAGMAFSACGAPAPGPALPHAGAQLLAENHSG